MLDYLLVRILISANDRGKNQSSEHTNDICTVHETVTV